MLAVADTAAVMQACTHRWTHMQGLTNTSKTRPSLPAYILISPPPSSNLNLTLCTLHALVLCRNHLPPPSPISSTARAFVPISPHAADHATTYPPAFTVPSFAQHIEPGTFMVTPDLAYTHSPNTLTPPLSTEGQEAWVPPPNSINCGQAGFPPMMAFGTTSVFKTEKSVIAS